MRFSVIGWYLQLSVNFLFLMLRCAVFCYWLVFVTFCLLVVSNAAMCGFLLLVGICNFLLFFCFECCDVRFSVLVIGHGIETY